MPSPKVKRQGRSRDRDIRFWLNTVGHMRTRTYGPFSLRSNSILAASWRIACNRKTLKGLKYLSSDEISLPILLPYGPSLNPMSRSMLISKCKRVAKNAQICLHDQDKFPSKKWFSGKILCLLWQSLMPFFQLMITKNKHCFEPIHQFLAFLYALKFCPHANIYCFAMSEERF